MKKIFFILLILPLLAACQNKKGSASDAELLKTEKQFSAMSVEQGMVAAFTHFCDEDGTLLRPDSYPVVGKEAVTASMANLADSLFTLSWEVIHASIALSGDLGYTYGTYTMTSKTNAFPQSRGTYVTIWKKNEDGDWKFVLDTGQEGLGE